MTEFNRKQVEALFLIRDGKQMCLDGINQFLEQLEPKSVELTQPSEHDFNNFKVELKESDKGNYEQIKNDDSEAFRVLQNWLSEHGGFATLYGFKLWFHLNDESIIDRRRG